jgi:hypothetical protein
MADQTAQRQSSAAPASTVAQPRLCPGADRDTAAAAGADVRARRAVRARTDRTWPDTNSMAWPRIHGLLPPLAALQLAAACHAFRGRQAPA